MFSPYCLPSALPLVDLFKEIVLDKFLNQSYSSNWQKPKIISDNPRATARNSNSLVYVKSREIDNDSDMSIEKLQPAEKAAVGIYMPYYQGAKRNVLPLAISLYQQGSLEGQRYIEGGEGIPFVATWFVSKIPSELTRCRLQFDGNAELSYEVTMANYEFVNYLIDVIMNFKRSRNGKTDFPQPFYRRLLRIED